MISEREKTGKLFNFERPTAEIHGRDLVIKAFPGTDYVHHYALVIATYLAMTGRPADTVTYQVPEAPVCRTAVDLLRLDLDGDLVIVGWGLHHLTPSGGVWIRGPGYAWQRAQVHGRRVVYLGFLHSIWGDVAGRVVARLAALGARDVVYVGKVGTLVPEIEPNTMLATGNEGLVHGSVVAWEDFFGGFATAQPGVHTGVHVTSPSILLEEEPVGAGPVEALRWLGPVLAAHAESALRLTNHLRYFRIYFAGTELEYKYNLTPGTDIWAASMEVLKALRHGELADCRPEYREEFEINYFDNHMFDVIGPDQERGYASFIPTVNGTHVLKRKWFTEDAFARREQLFPDIEISSDEFEEYLRSALGLQVQPLPPFQRVRYDIHCESRRTGHVFGIFFDRCSLLAAPDIVLSQCEMEYRRSRSLLDHDDEEVLQEMERIDSWLLSYLTARGQTKERTFYSKRSFLRDAIAVRPDLVATCG